MGSTYPASTIRRIVFPSAVAGSTSTKRRLALQQIGDRHQFVSLVPEARDDPGQGLGGVRGGQVQQHDGAAVRLAQHPRLDGGGRGAFPVLRVDVPEDHIAEPLDGGRAGDELVGESARGTEEAGRVGSGGRGEGAGAVADLDHQRPPGERGAVCVAAGMIADLEAVLRQLLGKVRTQVLVVADHEHGGRDVLLLQNAECLERPRKLIVVIERQRDTGSVGGAMAHGDERGGWLRLREAPYARPPKDAPRRRPRPVRRCRGRPRCGS